MQDLLINLLASIIAGTAVWAAQYLLRYRRLARQRAFFGMADGVGCVLAVSRHASSPDQLSVHRRDVAALVELATIARDCGGRADLVAEGDLPLELGRLTEFSVGGPHGNPRTAAHLRSILRGVTVAPYDPAAAENRQVAITVGGTVFRREPHLAEYVLIARAWGPAGGKPLFVLAGQTARSNLAAARFLAGGYPELHRRYRASEPFCLVLRVVEPSAYGTAFIEVAADVTADAFTAL